MQLAHFTQKQPSLTKREALDLKEEAAWQQLGIISVKEGIEAWLASLESNHTRINYTSALNRLVEFGFLDISISLQQLAMIAGNAMIDKVKQVPEWSESTKQARAAAMLSFFRFLSRRTDGLIKRLQPSNEGNSKTFFKVRDTVTTQAMTQSQWSKWLIELEKMNLRDALIAKVALQGGKRIGEVLSLQVDQIDFDKLEITFQQSKSKTFRQTIITYPENLMKQLKDYIGYRAGFVFITSRGNCVLRKQVAYTFARSGERSGVPFLVTPHVLRASAITYLKSQGYSDSEIRQITGHASSDMVAAYDKRAKADNISKNVSLIG